MQNEIDISSITWDETDSSGIDVSSITWDEEATQENKFSESKIDIAKDVIGNRMNDVAVGLTQGAAQAGKAVLGAADLGLAASNEFSPVTQIRRAAGHDAKAPTIIGGINEVYGGDLFKEAQTAGDQLKTPEMQLAKKAVDTGFDEGLIEGAIALGKNPLAISDMAVQSLPQMATLAVAARQKAAQIFMEAGGGEAGKAAIQQALPMLSKYSLSLEAGQSGGGYAGDKSADGLTPQELAGAGLSAAGTYAGGTLARKLGFGDVEAAQIAEKYGVGTMTGLVSNFIKKGAAEAVEETPQSVFETMGANVGDGKPLMEGTGRAAVEGAAAGFATGGAMSLSQRSGGQASTDQTVNGIRPEGFGAQTAATDMPSRDQFETDADYQAAFNEAMDAKEKQTAEPMTESATVAPVEKTQEEIDHDTEVQKYAEGLKTQAEKEGIDAEAKAAKDAMTRAEKNMKAVAGLDPSEPGYQAAYQSLSEALALKKAVASKKAAFDEKVKSVPQGDLMSRDDIVNLNKDAESEMQVSRNLNKQVDEMQSEIDVANPPDWMSKEDIQAMADKVREDDRIAANIKAQNNDEQMVALEPDMVQELTPEEAQRQLDESKLPPAPVAKVIPKKELKNELKEIPYEWTDIEKGIADAKKMLSSVEDKKKAFELKQMFATWEKDKSAQKVKEYLDSVPANDSLEPVSIDPAEKAIISIIKSKIPESNTGEPDIESIPFDKEYNSSVKTTKKAEIKDGHRVNHPYHKQQLNYIADVIDKSDRKTIFDAIKEYGGIRVGELSNQFGYGNKELAPLLAKGVAVSNAKKGGSRNMALDDMATELAQDGWLQLDENGKPDTSDLEDLILRAMSGEKVYNYNDDANAEFSTVESRYIAENQDPEYVSKAIRKMNSGGKLTAKEADIISSLLDSMDAELNDTQTPLLMRGNNSDGDITDETQVPMFMKMASDARSDLIKQGRVVRALSFQAETRPELSQKLSEERAKLRSLSSRYWNMAEKRVAPKVPLSWKAKQKFNAAKRSLKKSVDDVKFLLGGKTKQISITFIERKDIAKAKADEQAMRDIARKKRPVPIQKGDNAPLAMKVDKAEGKSKQSSEMKSAIEKALPFLKGHIEVIDSIEDLGADTKDKLKAIGADGTERGLYDPSTGKAYVFASNNVDAGEAIVAAMHEAVGHKGVYAVLGKEKSKVLSALANSKDAGIQKVADAVRKTYAKTLAANEKSYGKAASDVMLGAEIVARISESNVNIPVIKRVKLMLADTLSKITGRNKVESVADVELLLKRSRDYLKSGAKPTKPTGGKPVAMKSAKDAVTDSAAFKKWFGGSKVVDESGNPKVMYHGTKSSFDVFRSSSQAKGLLFFTDDATIASDYATEGGGYTTMADAENRVNLKIFREQFPNPTDEDVAGNLDIGSISTVAEMDKFEDSLKNGANVMPVYVKSINPMGSKENPIPWREAEKLGVDKIKSMGYDGVWVTEGKGVALAVVDKKQIKSATGNNGNFDPENDSILAMRRPVDAINSITRKPSARRFTAKARAFAAKNLTKERGLTKADYSARDEALGIRMEINGVIAPKISQAFQNEWKKLYGKDDFSKHPDVIYNVLKFMRGEKATLPAELQKVAMMMRNEIDAASDKVRDVIKDRVKYSTDAMNANSLAAFSQYLTDAKAISESQLPDEAKDKQIEMAAQQAIKEARGDKNAESQAGLVAQAITDISMVQTLEAGKGSYLNRAYQAHNDPHWRSRIIDDTVPYGDPDHIIDKKVYDAAAADILKANPDATEDEVYNAISTILLKADSVANPMAHLGLSSEVKKLGVLKRRKLDDMPGVRRLLGEYQNPVNIFSTTLAKQGNIVAAHHFMKTMRENGLETGLMSEKQGGANQYQIQGGKGMEPLSGLWTTVEYGKTIEAILEKMPSGAVSRMILTAAGAIKKGKTVFSPSTNAVNFISNSTASWRNGHLLNIEQHVEAIKMVIDYIKGKQEAVDQVKKLASLGVFSESAYQTELEFMFEDKVINEYASFIDKNMPAILKGGAKGTKAAWEVFDKVMSDSYQMGDTIWKTSGFLQEVERYKGRGMSQVEAEKAAAERIKDTYPTYNRVSAFVDILKRNPFFSDFPSFAWEQARTSYHQAKYIKQDYEQGYKSDAMRGVANYLFGIGALPLLAFALSKVNGWDDEEVQDYIKMFGADWMRHGSYILSEPDEKGNVTPINLGRLNMYDTQVKMVKSMITAIRNGDIESFVTDPIIIAFKSLVGIEFTAQAITDAFDGVDAYGEKLSDANASSSEMAVDRLKYLFKTLGPTLITQQGGNLVKANASTINEALDKAGLGSIAVEGATKGREFSNKNEAMSLIGLRTHTDATPRVLSRIARTELSDASRDIGKVKALLSSTDKVPDAQIQEYVNDALDNSYRRKERIAKAAAMLIDKGVEKALLADALETANVKQSDVSKYLRGEVPEYDPSKTTLSNMKEAMGKYNVPRADIHHRLIVFKKAIKEYNSQKE